MLPGFRFLFAAIVLSMSVMVFGLGAAALLRAAHEEFASNPSWHATPETTFAQQSEATRPVLAMLRIEPPPAEQKIADDVPAAAMVTAPVEPIEPAAPSSMPAQPEKIAALTSADPAPVETAQPDTPAKPEVQVEEIKTAEIKATEIKPLDAPTSTERAPAPVDAPSPIAVAETKIATAEQASPPANDVAPAASDPTNATIALGPAITSTKIATLGGPAVTIETAAPKPAKAAANTRKRVQARRASLRRRMALRARLARPVLLQPLNPFGTPPAAGG
jgi:hypothetical protein